MLAKRIIPTLLCRGRQLVKGQRFDAWRSVGLVQQGVRIHQTREVDELVLLDIGATQEQRGPDLALVRELADTCFMPLAVGGGVRTVDDVRELLRAGADKVVVGTAAFTHPDWLAGICRITGSQAIVAAVDYRNGQVYVQSGQVKTPFDPIIYAQYLAKRGVGEILLTCIDREGSMEGYDLDMICKVTEAVDVPVIAHGGAGTYDHMHHAFLAGASGAAAGSLFQFTDATPKGAAEFLAAKMVEVRL